MESLRPLIADSSIVKAINNGEVRPTDYVHVAGSVALTDDGRKYFIGPFERHMSQEVTHPVFSYKVSYRQLLEIQASLLRRYLLGDIPEHLVIKTR